MPKSAHLTAALAAAVDAIAQANQVNADDVRNGFAVQPAIAQKMYDEIALNSGLLGKISIVGKTEQVGELVGLSTGLIGSTAKTADPGVERKPRSIHNLTGRKYTLLQTNFDTALRYEEIDAWAYQAPDFAKRINAKIAESVALSLIAIGMNGKTRADNSDFAANPLLQDVAKGWLQKMREENPSRVLGWQSGQVGVAKKEVKYGAAADAAYKNLDAVVTDVLNELIDERFADRTDFVVIASRRTVGDKYLRIINTAADKATELEAAGGLSKERTLGGLPVVYVPHMPQDILLITPLKNLSIYYQTGAERRTLIDNPKKDQIESYLSKNIDFNIEEYGAAALVEKTTVKTVEKKKTIDVAGKKIKTLRHLYATEASALAGARAAFARIRRGLAEFSISLATGRPDLYPETPVTVQGFKAEIDAESWLIVEVAHRLGDGGYTCSLKLEARLKEERAGEEAEGKGKNGQA